jgi:hypothetical protein
VLVNLPLLHGARSTSDDDAVTGTGLLVTLLADLVLVAVLVMLLRGRGLRGRRRAQLHAVALGDVEHGEPSSALDRLGGSDYLIRGVVAETDDGRVVLELGDRRVVVLLDGHANPVDPEQSAQVRGRLLD